MAEAIAQTVLALTLLFGIFTILPRAIGFLMAGRRARGMMYLLIVAVFVFFAAMSVLYAITSFTRYGKL